MYLHVVVFMDKSMLKFNDKALFKKVLQNIKVKYKKFNFAENL